MKELGTFGMRMGVLVVGILMWCAMAQRASAQVILVDDDKVQCPNAQYTSISQAVSSAPGGSVIRVCPGTYVEQVTISNKTLRIEGDNGAIVMPPTMSANGMDPVSGEGIAAAILVENSSNVGSEGV